jgi:uncharacterized protein with PIN domain
MLGKLARWLRALGFDAAFFQSIEDDELLRLSRQEGRVLLTRDTELCARAGEGQVLFISSQDWHSQVRQVLDAFDLRGRVTPYSRCLECNARLKTISKSEARNLVAPFVYETASGFSLCPGCGRVFWKGTHQNDMEEMIADILRKG